MQLKTQEGIFAHSAMKYRIHHVPTTKFYNKFNNEVKKEKKKKPKWDDTSDLKWMKKLEGRQQAPLPMGHNPRSASALLAKYYSAWKNVIPTLSSLRWKKNEYYQ